MAYKQTDKVTNKANQQSDKQTNTETQTIKHQNHYLK